MTVKLFWLMISCALAIPFFIRMIRQIRQAHREHNYKWMINCLLLILATIMVCVLIYLALS